MGSALLLLLVFIPACGPDSETAIAVRVLSPEPDSAGTREFNETNPPDWVLVDIVRHSQLIAAGSEHVSVARVEPAWDELEVDEYSGRKILLLRVPPNEGKEDPYVLMVASKVADLAGVPHMDECGASGGIEAGKGQKVRVDVSTHLSQCGPLCTADSRCSGERYCLSFECQDAKSCTADDQCPLGARCASGSCTGQCGAGLPSCPTGFTCCGNICAASCAG